MAWNIHWQCVFQSFGGTTYAINIYEQNYNGTKVQLTGADEPFTTQENDNEDIFTSIRSQTGYLRVIDEDGTLLEQLIPANNIQRLVRVMSGTWANNAFTPDIGNGATKWAGFLQAEGYTQEITGKNIVEIPVANGLVTLGSLFLPTSDLTKTKTFGQIIIDAFTQIDSYTNGNIVLISSLNDPNDLLLAQIDLRTFFTVSDNVDGVTVHSASYADVLDAMLTLFGLTARMEGNTFYMANYDKRQTLHAYQYTAVQLYTLVGGGTVTPTELEIDYNPIYDVVEPKGNSNQMSYIQGVSTAAVELNIQGDEETLADMPRMPETQTTVKTVDLSNGKFYVQGGDVREDSEQGYRAYTRTPNALCYETFFYVSYDFRTNGNYEWFFENGTPELFSNFRPKTIITDTIANITNYVNKTFYTGAQPSRFFYNSESGYISLLNGIMIQMKHVNTVDTSAVNNVVYHLHTVQQYNFGRGVLSLNMKNIVLVNETSTIRKENGTSISIWLSLMVGNKYWNGFSWEEAFTIFKVSFNDSGSLNFDNSQYQDEYNVDIDGMWFPIPSGTTLNGEVKLGIYDSYSEPAAGPFWAASFIYDVNLKYIQVDEISSTHYTENVYEETNILRGFSDEKRIELKIGTYNNNVSSPVFVKRNGSMMQKIGFYTGDGTTSYQARPEVNLLNRVWQHYGEARRTLTLRMQRGVNIMHNLFSYNNRNYFGIRQSTNWRDDTEDVKFIEVHT